jgi:hypothetical protein
LRFVPYFSSDSIECCDDAENYRAGLPYVMKKLCTYPTIESMYITINYDCLNLIGILTNTIMACTHQPDIGLHFNIGSDIIDTVINNNIIPMIRTTSNIISLSLHLSSHLKDSTLDSLVKCIYVDNYSVEVLCLVCKNVNSFTNEKLEMMTEWLHRRKKPVKIMCPNMRDVAFGKFYIMSYNLITEYENKKDNEHVIVKLDEIKTILTNSSIKRLEIIN